MRMLSLIVAFLSLVLVSCGKNDGFTQTAYNPYNQPLYQGNGLPTGPQIQPPPTTYTPNYTMPPGQPQQFQPFAPFYNYMQQQNQSYYWQQLWYNWQVTAYQYNISPYNYNVFMNSYCPQVWSYSPYYSNWQQTQNWFDIYVGY